MFAINRLFSKKSELDARDQYTKVASLIEEGSILDRRKPSSDRRRTIESNVSLRDAFSGVEKRSNKDRRSNSNQHMEEYLDKVEEDESVDNDIEAQSLDDVDTLLRDQKEIIKDISELSDAAKLNEFQGIKEKIRDITVKIKGITREEEKLLYLSFDKNVVNSSEKTDKSLSEILSYVHDVSDQVLKYLDRYYYSDVTEVNVGFFLLDMNIVCETLNQILDKKQEHLYSMYK